MIKCGCLYIIVSVTVRGMDWDCVELRLLLASGLGLGCGEGWQDVYLGQRYGYR